MSWNWYCTAVGRYSVERHVQTAGDDEVITETRLLDGDVRQQAWFVGWLQQQVEHVAANVCGSVDVL